MKKKQEDGKSKVMFGCLGGSLVFVIMFGPGMVVFTFYTWCALKVLNWLGCWCMK